MSNLKKMNMKNLKKRCFLIALTVALIQSLILFKPVLADDGAIKIAGQPVFSLTSAGDSGTLAKRTETVQNNLDNALVAAQDRTPASVNISYVKGTPVITLGGYQVATVSGSDAAAAKTTPALLANQWADSIRGALVNQSSINSYVAQLSGNYALSAPAASLAPASTVAGAAAASNYGNSGTPTANAAPAYPQSASTNTGPSAPESYNANSNPNYNVGANNYNSPGNYGYAPAGGYRQGHVVYAPAGQIIPITLKTSIDTEIAKAGDLIEGSISQNINLGESSIPVGTNVVGQVESAKAGGRFTKSGNLQIEFTQLQLPDGSSVPISAHIVGGIGKYAKGKQAGQVEGENWKNKLGSVAFRGLLGAGGGAALGTAVGAIAGGGSGAGAGAWSGAAIGSGVGVADSLILRKGANVKVPSGTNIQLQLDQPVSISVGMGAPGYNGGFTPGGPPVSGNYNVGGYGGAPQAGYGGSYAGGQPAGGYSGGYSAGQPTGNYGSGYGAGQPTANYGGGYGGAPQAGYNSSAPSTNYGSGYNNGGYQPQSQYNPPPLH